MKTRAVTFDGREVEALALFCEGMADGILEQVEALTEQRFKSVEAAEDDMHMLGLRDYASQLVTVAQELRTAKDFPANFIPLMNWDFIDDHIGTDIPEGLRDA